MNMDFEKLDSILPANFNYEIIAKRSCRENENNEEVRLKVALFSANDIKLWIKALEEQSCCNYSIRSTKQRAGVQVLFKQRLACHHNTRHTKTYNRTLKNRTRNTNCPSALIITLQAVQEGNSKNAPDPLMPCLITFVITHNHNIISADAFRFRRVVENTKDKLIELYKSGHSPATALESIKIEIQLSNDNCEIQLADRSICPDYNYCYYLFKKEFEKLYGAIDGDKHKTFLIEKLKEYNEQMDNECAMFDIKESAYVITLCPPLFKRIHQNIDSASEIVFMDATATVDHEGSKIFILSTHSQCGGLPLGIIITSSETAENIALGFLMLKTMLGNIIFHHKIGGPQIFMTDDCEAEHIAIKSVWTNSTCLLCIFHVLQAVYRWLVSSKNGIPNARVKQFFEQFRLIMYAMTTAECEENYNTAVNTAQQYPNYVRYLQTYWCKREMWALSYRSFLLVRGNHTNNISEAAMRLLKDKILNRVKAFNIVQLVDFLLTRFVQYYQRRLLDAAHNRSIKDKLLQTIRLPTTDIIEKIQKLSETMYSVPSEKSVHLRYIVYTDVLICTCFRGNTGFICKHIDWVHMIYHSDAYRKRIDNIETRTIFYKIATGEVPPSKWLLPLNKLDGDIVGEGFHSNALVSISSHTEPEAIGAEEDEEEEAKRKSATIQEGNELILDMSEWFTDFLNRSPIEVVAALKAMKMRRTKIKTMNAFVSSCSTFSSEFQRTNRGSKISVQPTAISRRKSNIAGKGSHVGGRPRKGAKFKAKVEHSVSNKLRKRKLRRRALLKTRSK